MSWSAAGTSWRVRAPRWAGCGPASVFARATRYRTSRIEQRWNEVCARLPTFSAGSAPFHGGDSLRTVLEQLGILCRGSAAAAAVSEWRDGDARARAKQLAPHRSVARRLPRLYTRRRDAGRSAAANSNSRPSIRSLSVPRTAAGSCASASLGCFPEPPSARAGGIRAEI